MSVASRTRDAHLVTGLMMSSWSLTSCRTPPVYADEVPGDLPRHDEDRRRRGVGRADGGGGVLQARPGDYQRGPDLAAGSGVSVGHVSGSLLVACRYKANLRLAMESVHRVVRLHAGQPEDHPRPLSMQGGRQGVSTGHFGQARPFPSGSWCLDKWVFRNVDSALSRGCHRWERKFSGFRRSPAWPAPWPRLAALGACP